LHKSALSIKAKKMKVQDLLRTALQWYHASSQDTDALTSALHASKGDAFLSAARTMMADEDIEQFHPHLRSLIAAIENQQNASIIKLQRELLPKSKK
jgi:hypothetical protein